MHFRPEMRTCDCQGKETALALKGVVVFAPLSAIASLQVEQQRPWLLDLWPHGHPDALGGLPAPAYGVHLLKCGPKLYVIMRWCEDVMHCNSIAALPLLA